MRLVQLGCGEESEAPPIKSGRSITSGVRFTVTLSKNNTGSPRFTPGMRSWTNRCNRNRRKLKRFYNVNQWKVNDMRSRHPNIDEFYNGIAFKALKYRKNNKGN
jgi:hypothetical protein